MFRAPVFAAAETPNHALAVDLLVPAEAGLERRAHHRLLSISTGAYSYPKGESARIVVSVIKKYDDKFDEIIVCCFSAGDKNDFTKAAPVQLNRQASPLSIVTTCCLGHLPRFMP